MSAKSLNMIIFNVKSFGFFCDMAVGSEKEIWGEERKKDRNKIVPN